MTDLPTFTASAYTTNNTRGDLMIGQNALRVGGGEVWPSANDINGWAEISNRRLSDYRAQMTLAQYKGKQEHTTVAANSKSPLRVVRVFLVDSDDRIPVDKRILYRSDEMTTDATDQELFFSIPVNDLLKEHNAFRAGVQWEEKTSEGTKSKTGLKEARIRDLVMSVTTVASFAA